MKAVAVLLIIGTAIMAVSSYSNAVDDKASAKRMVDAQRTEEMLSELQQQQQQDGDDAVMEDDDDGGAMMAGEDGDGGDKKGRRTFVSRGRKQLLSRAEDDDGGDGEMMDVAGKEGEGDDGDAKAQYYCTGMKLDRARGGMIHPHALLLTYAT